ncbi:MAG: hypothetical protein EXS13_08720 [Planctomycetes bacterium]|nr:hypothetical protein [Planctomycetota bacterium]
MTQLQPRVRVPVEFHVVSAWRIGPKQCLSFGHSKPGERCERSIHVAARRGDPAFNVTGASLLPKRKDERVDYAETSIVAGRDGNGFEIVVKLVSDPIESYFFADLIVETNDPVTPTQRLPVFGFRDPP